MGYALEERVPDVDSKSLVSVCNDVSSTPIQLNHGVILSLQTTVRNVFDRLAFEALVSFRERERKAGGWGKGGALGTRENKTKNPFSFTPFSLCLFSIFAPPRSPRYLQL